MGKSFRLFVSFLVLGASVAVKADPPPASHHYWQNKNYNSHYVLYDAASKTYLETVNCKVLWKFTVVSNELNTLTLFDASRGMTVKLNYDGMYLKEKGAKDFVFYQAGAFDTRQRFEHRDAKDVYTGVLIKQHACSWLEYLSGSSKPNWYFTEVSRNKDYVDLYDKSRDMLVRLTKDKMYLRTGTNQLAFFKNGHW